MLASSNWNETSNTGLSNLNSNNVAANNTILTEFVVYRGKKKQVSDLKPTSSYKVDVLCPNCGEIRTVYYRSIYSAGHCICLKCIRKLKQRKHLERHKKFGKLTVIERSKKAGHSICKCECGKIVEVTNYNLKTGHTKSCGCLRSKNFKDRIPVSGKNHGNWKGGISNLRERAMQSKEYKKWREDVFIRDDYICQKCNQRGYNLNAHHIYDYSKNKKCRLEKSNGITLCKKCHINFHKIYGRSNNEDQLKTFLNI